MADYSRYKKIYSGKKLKDYLDLSTDRVEKVVVQENDKGYTLYKDKLIVKIPTIVGYANFIGRTEATLYNWAKEYKEFRQALDVIKAKQKQALIEHGLDGTYNSAIAKLVLSSNHGMSDHTDVTSGGEPIQSFTDDQVDRIAERIARRRKGDGNK